MVHPAQAEVRTLRDEAGVPKLPASFSGHPRFKPASAVELVHDGIRVNVVAPGTIHLRYVTGAVLAMDGGWTAS